MKTIHFSKPFRDGHNFYQNNSGTRKMSLVPSKRSWRSPLPYFSLTSTITQYIYTLYLGKPKASNKCVLICSKIQIICIFYMDSRFRLGILYRGRRSVDLAWYTATESERRKYRLKDEQLVQRTYFMLNAVNKKTCVQVLIIIYIYIIYVSLRNVFTVTTAHSISRDELQCIIRFLIHTVVSLWSWQKNRCSKWCSMKTISSVIHTTILYLTALMLLYWFIYIIILYTTIIIQLTTVLFFLS